MAYVVWHTNGPSDDQSEFFTCSVCGEACNEELYVCPHRGGEKACHVCGPEQGYEQVLDATFVSCATRE